jgi:hypothetical protein
MSVGTQMIVKKDVQAQSMLMSHGCKLVWSNEHHRRTKTTLQLRFACVEPQVMASAAAAAKDANIR